MRETHYREALLTYIDILGFRELIDASVIDQSAVPTILNTLNHLKKQTSEGGRVIREKGGEQSTSIFRAFNFSDLTVRATYIDTSTDYVDVLNWEFLYLSGIQIGLTCELKILLRGGISIGKISIEPDIAVADDIVFGPALVRSYDLESAAAIKPRLIVDAPVIQKVTRPESLWWEYIHKDEDGQFFVDYLFGAVKDGLLYVGDKSLSAVETLQRHQNSVEEKINALAGRNPRILEKLRWLVSYHNNVVKRFQGLHSKSPDPYDVFDEKPSEIPDSLLISNELLK